MIKELGKVWMHRVRSQKLLTKRKYKEQQNIKKNAVTEMKNILEGINSRLSDSEEQIGELEHSSGNHHH